MRIPAAAMALLVPALVLSATVPRKARRPAGPVSSAKEAKAIAERETGGQATRARRVPLNGASGGWEVDVRMPREAQGWRCLIDADTRLVHSKTRIDQPAGAAGPLQVVKGTR